MRSTLLLSLVILGISLSVAAQQQSYVFNRADFPINNGPRDIAIADFDGDGQADLAVATASGVAIFLGKPDGTLGTEVDYATDHTPFALVAGDFNKDGKVDLAVIDVFNKMFILIGRGDGTFAAPVDYPTAQAPDAIVTGDFNGDGKTDLAVADSNCAVVTCQAGWVSIFLGNGDGTFQAKMDFAVGAGAQALVVQDFNGDSKLDLAVVNNSSNTLSILLGNGDGTFQPEISVQTANKPEGIAAADFDGDKIVDLAVTHVGNLTFLKGNGDGTFQAESTIASLIASSVIKTADLNSDGKVDLVLNDGADGGIAVLLGNGDGTFQPPAFYAAQLDSAALAIADINGDNNLDIAVSNGSSNSITVLLGNGNGSFSPRASLPLGVSNVSQVFPLTPVIMDFNGDGIPDLAVGEGAAGQIAVLLGKGNGSFENVKLSNTGGSGGFGSIAAADFNGDGILDIALPGGSGIAIMLGNGDGTFSSEISAATIASVSRGFVTGDFNNDGKQDLVVLGNGFLQTNPIYTFIGNGDGTFQSPRQFWSSTDVPLAIAASDLNHDGNLDIVIDLDEKIAVMLGNGDGSFQPPVEYTTDSLSGNGLTIADLNGDSIPDIIVAGDKVDVFLGKGDGTFASAVTYNGGNFPEQVITGDFNADGKVDIIVAAEGSSATGDIEILFGNGDGTFQPPIEIADGSTTGGALAVGDLNQDGTSDLVFGGGLGSWYLSAPIATLSPTRLNFGTVNIGMIATQSVTLTNSGNGPLNLLNFLTNSAYTAPNTCTNPLPIAGTCAVDVNFTPVMSGTSSGTLIIADNASPGQQTIALTGSGEANFSLAIASGSSASQTVKAGSTASYSLNVTPLGGFAQSVSFSCTGAPATTTCAVTPSLVTLDGTTTSTVTVKVTTTAPTAAIILPNLQDPGLSHSYGFLLAFGILPLGLLVCRRVPAAQRVRVMNLLLVLAFFAMSAISCGGGGSTGTPGSGGTGSNSSGPSSGTPGTTAGSYTLTVTASSGSGSNVLQRTEQLTLTVN